MKEALKCLFLDYIVLFICIVQLIYNQHDVLMIFSASAFALLINTLVLRDEFKEAEDTLKLYGDLSRENDRLNQRIRDLETRLSRYEKV